MRPVYIVPPFRRRGAYACAIGNRKEGTRVTVRIRR